MRSTKQQAVEYYERLKAVSHKNKENYKLRKRLKGLKDAWEKVLDTIDLCLYRLSDDEKKTFDLPMDEIKKLVEERAGKLKESTKAQKPKGKDKK